MAHSECDPSIFPEPPPPKDVHQDLGIECSYLLHYMCSWHIRGRTFSTTTGPDQLPLSEVKEATKELQSEWYSIAVELEISHSIRKVGMVTDHL